MLTELAKLLDKSIGAAAKDQMKVGATSANIAPADQKAAEKLDSRFAVKATQLDVFDIQELPLMRLQALLNSHLKIRMLITATRLFHISQTTM